MTDRLPPILAFVNAARSFAWAIYSLHSMVAIGQYWQEVIIPAPLEVGTNGRFGSALSLDSDRLLVGASGTSQGAQGSGAAYLFKRDQGGQEAWDEIAGLHSPGPTTDARFGEQVLLHGNLAFVSAPGDNYAELRTGSVYIFEKDLGGGETWSFKQQLRPEVDLHPDAIQDGLAFGSWLWSGEDKLIVACPGYDEDPTDALTGVGALAIYKRNGLGYFESYRFIRGDSLVDEVTARPCMGQWFGVLGDLFIHQQEENNGVDDPRYQPGRAYYLHADSLLAAAVDLPVAHALELTGTFGDPPDAIIMNSAAVNESMLMVGLWHHRSQEGFHRAVSFVSDGSGGLLQRADATPDSAAGTIQFWPLGRDGWDVLGLSDHRLLIGARGDDTFTPLGHAEVFRNYDLGQTAWHRVAYLQQSDALPGDLFGAAGAIDEGLVVLGAPKHGPLDRGQVYVFLDPDVGLEDLARTSSATMRVYPDPVSQSIGHLNITFSEPIVAGHVLLGDMQGRCILRLRAQPNMQMPLADIPAGMYTLSWVLDDPTISAVTTRVIVTP